MTGALADIWLLDARELDDAMLSCWAQRLGASERQRCAAFRRKERRGQFIAGRMLLRLVAEALSGVHGGSIEITERRGNAPLLAVAGSAVPVPYFSLSHSGGWIACAASTVTAVGVDVELMDPSRDIAALAEQAFGAQQTAQILALPACYVLAAFYGLWSRREAEFKLQQAEGHYYSLPHASLSIALCTARPLVAAPALHLLQSSQLHTYSLRLLDC
jgi:4'-phosphopantetheinyl transferase